MQNIFRYEIDEEYLQRLEAEFIISTVPIPQAPVPVVVVTPMLNQGDMERIQVRLQQQPTAIFPQRKSASASISSPITS